MELTEPPSHPRTIPGGLKLAISVSIGLHLLLLWLSTFYPQSRYDSYPPSAPPRSLHITIAKQPHSQDTEPQQPTPSDSKQEQTPRQADTDDMQQQTQAESNPPNLERVPKRPIRGAISGNKVTTPQIYNSAAAVSRDIAESFADEPGDGEDPLSETFDRILKQPKETPGIYSRADGTTRIVTEYGISYCIKASDDWRIGDPGEDLPVSVSCR